jgi:hypothetical protein
MRLMANRTPKDWEDVIAKSLDAEFCKDHAFVDVNGVTFDFKHEVGQTSIPHGKASAINKELLWSMLWAERGLTPKPDILIRSHVHRFHAAMDEDGLRMTTPGMQLWSNYGVRKFSSTISMGFLTFDIEDDGSYKWRPHLLDLQFVNEGAIEL